MECVRTGDCYQSGDGRVHPLQAHRASREFINHRFIRSGEPSDGGRSNVLGVDSYRQNADNMAYFRLNTRMSRFTSGKTSEDNVLLGS